MHFIDQRPIGVPNAVEVHCCNRCDDRLFRHRLALLRYRTLTVRIFSAVVPESSFAIR